MNEKLLSALLELIKLDMERIQHYGDVILNISIILVMAAFTLSAFIYSKGTRLSQDRIQNRVMVVVVGNVGILLALFITSYFYFYGLDGSRIALNKREAALIECLEHNAPITVTSLYPKIENADYRNLQMHSYLEKSPAIISFGLILIKMCVELLFWRKKILFS